MSEALRVITGLKGILANANDQAIVSVQERGTKLGDHTGNEATMLFCQVTAIASVLQAEMLIEIHRELQKENDRSPRKKAKK